MMQWQLPRIEVFGGEDDDDNRTYTVGGTTINDRCSGPQAGRR